MSTVFPKLLSEIKNMYLNSLACIRVKKGESKCFRIYSGVKQGCIMSLWFFNVYMNAMMKEVKIGMGRMEMLFLEKGRECRLPGLLYVDDLILCGKSEQDLEVMVEHFVEVCRKRGLKVNANKSKVMVLGREERLECEISLDGG